MLQVDQHQGSMPAPGTLPDALLRVREAGDRGVTFITGGTTSHFLSYRQLYHDALGTLGALQQAGIAEGSEVVLQVEDNQAFLTVFWACVLGNMLVVPLSVGVQEEQRLKLFRVWNQLRSPYLVYDGMNLARLEKMGDEGGFAGQLSAIADRSFACEALALGRVPGTCRPAAAADTAFIQYSSGSTGQPKGVVLTHNNLITNISDIIRCSGTTAADTMLSWMPLTHDMGLIGVHLTGVVAQINHFLMPTPLFIRRPVLWIEKASEHRITQLYSPNFGYQYFLSAFRQTGAADLDLSRVRIIYNGAEPISFALCRQFAQALAPFGLKQEALCPVYGLAEASLAVTIPPIGAPVRVCTLHRDHLGVGSRVQTVAPGGNRSEGVDFVEVGYPVTQCAVRICTADNEAVAESTVGYVQIKGDNVTAGYYNDEAATRAVRTADGWLQTGDLGFWREGRLVITGRAKNLIKVNGQNYYPHDLERVVQELDGISAGTVVACGVNGPGQEQEQLVIFVAFKKDLSQFLPVIARVKEQILTKTGLPVEAVIPVRTIPKTTSGKTQYFKLIDQYQRGDFAGVSDQLRDRLAAANREAAGALADVRGRLAGLWASALDGLPVPEGTSFFEAGLNSLQAYQLALRIEQHFGVPVSVRDIFENPRLERLADCIRAKAGRAAGGKAVSRIAASAESPHYDLSYAQQRLWALGQYRDAAGAAAFNLPYACWLKGTLDPAAFERAFATVVARHESLRTNFFLLDGVPRQQAGRHAPLKVRYVGSQAAPSREQAAALALAEANTPFDLEHDLLLRVTLVQCGAAQYLAVVVMHHLVADGWSVNVLLDEVSHLYNAYRRGTENPLPPPALQFKDFVYWQQQQVQSAAAHRDYWAKELGGELPVPDLSALKPFPNQPPAAPGSIHGTLDDSLTDGLKKLSRENNTTLFATLITLLSVLLQKYSGQTDQFITTDLAGRTHPDLEKQIGYFLNTVGVRVKFDGGESFPEILTRVQATLWDVFEHQHYPLELLMAEWRREQNLKAMPLFNVFVVFQNFNSDFAFSFDHLEAQVYPVEVQQSLVDLYVEFTELHGRLSFAIRYNDRVLGEAQIKNLAGHFVALATRVLDNPGTPVGQLDVLTPGERHQLTVGFNDTCRPAGPEEHVVAMLEKAVAKHPNRVALTCGDRALTYQRLNQEANRLAQRLVQAHGVGREDRIGVMLSRSEQLVVSILAVLKAGAAYVPIDPAFPAERIAHMLADSGVRVLITDQPLSAAYPVALLHPEATAAEARAFTGRAPGALHRTTDLAYILYTSGSSGKPKGIMVEHAALADYLVTFAAYFALTPHDKVIQQASVSFDTSLEEMFPILCTGGQLVIVPEGARDIGRLVAVIARESATVLSTVPVVLNEINALAGALPTLRVVISGGDRLRPSQIDRLVEVTRVYNTYGPTEATVCATFHPVQHPAESAVIGKPIANHQLYILDGQGQPVPVGVPGELGISGAGLARGYLNQPGLTDEKFIPHPFRAGARLYLTGDTGRWLPDGSIEFIGRKDHQVKLRGLRIELPEIESTLLRYEGITGAAAVVKEDQDLVLYFSSTPPVTAEALRGWLAKHLPAYMIPAYFVPVPVLPVTTSGKLDLKSLPDYREACLVDRAGYAAPQNSTEATLVQVWATVLGHDKIGTRDNFFEIGGDSIKAIQIVAHLRKAGMGVEAATLFQHQTIERLAAQLAGSDAGAPVSGTIRPTPPQVLLLGEKTATFRYFTHAVQLEVKKPVPPAFLGEALGKMVSHHEGLRLHQRAGEPGWVINNACLAEAFPIEVVEATSPESPEAVLARLKAGVARQESLLFKAAALVREGRVTQLLMASHCAIMDARSWEILLGDLGTLIRGYGQATPGELPPRTTSLVEWSRRVDARLAPDAPLAEAAAPRRGNLNKTTLVLPKRKTSTLLGGTTAFADAHAHPLLLAALGLALRQWTGRHQFTVALLPAGRDPLDRAFSRTIGALDLPRRATLAPRPEDLPGTLAQAKALLGESAPDVPPTGRPPGGSEAAADASFQFCPDLDKALNNDVFAAGNGVELVHYANAGLLVNATVLAQSLCIEIHYDAGRYPEAQMSGLRDQYKNAINRLIAYTQAKGNRSRSAVAFETVTLDEEDLSALFGESFC